MKHQLPSFTKLQVLAPQQKAEHLAIAKRLKKKTPKDLDHTVHGWNDEFFDEINCLDCGNCCRTMDRHLTATDIRKLARFFRQKESDFILQYLQRDDDGDYVFKDHICPFFESDNSCLVYEVRPRSCREYPYMHSPKFYQFLKLSLKSRAICPAVFQMFENLVEKYGV